MTTVQGRHLGLRLRPCGDVHQDAHLPGLQHAGPDLENLETAGYAWVVISLLEYTIHIFHLLVTLRESIVILYALKFSFFFIILIPENST